MTTPLGRTKDDTDNSLGDQTKVVASAVVTPQASTYTLKGQGVWLVTVVAKLNGSDDHTEVATFIVYYLPASSNKLMGTDQVGSYKASTGSSFSPSGVTCSAPSTSGVLSLTASWGAGSTHSAVWIVEAQRIGSLGV